MEVIGILIILLVMFVIPAAMGGLPIFLIVFAAFTLYGNAKAPNDIAKRQAIKRNGMLIGLVLGASLGFYVYAAMFTAITRKPMSTEDIAVSKFYREIFDGYKDNNWREGDVTKLYSWIDGQDEIYKYKMRGKLYQRVGERVSVSKYNTLSVDTDDNDLIVIQKLIDEFDPKLDLKSEHVLRNYLNIQRNGFRDFDLALANNTKYYDTYLYALITFCISRVDESGCRTHFTPDNIAVLERRKDHHSGYEQWLFEDVLDRLRQARE
ncbi:MAG: hypothetical protein V4660_10165 [Pseudomonadota bacterium]